MEGALTMTMTCWRIESMGRVMPGMESMVATTLLDAMVGAQGLAVVKSMVIWLMAIERIKPKST